MEATERELLGNGRQEWGCLPVEQAVEGWVEGEGADEVSFGSRKICKIARYLKMCVEARALDHPMESEAGYQEILDKDSVRTGMYSPSIG